MAGVVQLSPEQLKQQSRVYLQARDAIEQQLQSINKTNQTIAGQWKGQAFESYLQQYNQLSQQVKKFEELLASINQQLNQYAQTVAERDAQDAKSFGLK